MKTFQYKIHGRTRDINKAISYIKEQNAMDDIPTATSTVYKASRKGVKQETVVLVTTGELAQKSKKEIAKTKIINLSRIDVKKILSGEVSTQTGALISKIENTTLWKKLLKLLKI